MKKYDQMIPVKSKSLKKELFFKVVVPMFLVTCVIVVGTLGFSYIEKMPFHEALYVTVILASGGGYALAHPLTISRP